MRTALLLNDKRIAWYENGEERQVSPGFIYTDKKALRFGEAAEQQSRLHPLNTHHTFWHRLSQDTFARPVVNCRHAADMVFAHLNALFESGQAEANTEQQALLLTPANYNESQLALLSGVARHSQFKPRWMMPIPLAAAASQNPDAERCIVVEQYQHGLTLSLIRRQEQILQFDNVQLLPDLGYFSVANKLIQAASDAFVAQTRYNPQQNAAWEQSLYDDLPRWLTLLHQQETVIPCQLHTGSQEVSASLQALDCLDELAPSLEKLQQQWQGLKKEFNDVPVLLAGGSHLIPGLRDVFAEHSMQVVNDQTITRFAAQYVSSLDSGNAEDAEKDKASVALVRNIHLTPSAMSASNNDQAQVRKANGAESPAIAFAGTPYWLCHGVARSISPDQGCCLGLAGNVVSHLAPGEESNQAHVTISGAATIANIHGLTAKLNGQRANIGDQLKPGDVLSLGDQQVTFIAVEHDMAGDHGS